MKCVRCEGKGVIELHGLESECTLCMGEDDISLNYTLQWIIGHYELGRIEAKQALAEITSALGKVGAVIEAPMEG